MQERLNPSTAASLADNFDAKELACKFRADSSANIHTNVLFSVSGQQEDPTSLYEVGLLAV